MGVPEGHGRIRYSVERRVIGDETPVPNLDTIPSGRGDELLFEEGVCRARTHYCVGDGAAEARLKSPRARVRLASPKPLRGKPRGARD